MHVRLVLALLLLPLTTAAAQNCLPLDELVTVRGTIAKGPESRTMETTYILMLDKKVCVASQSKKVRELQLVIRSEHINKTIPHMLRDKLMVRGTLHEASSSRHTTPVVMDVETVLKAP